MSASNVIDQELLDFGRAIRTIRRDLGMSQAKLARATGLHRNYIGGVERGERNISLKNILRLARALRVPPAELFVPTP